MTDKINLHQSTHSSQTVNNKVNTQYTYTHK